MLIYVFRINLRRGNPIGRAGDAILNCYCHGNVFSIFSIFLLISDRNCLRIKRERPTETQSGSITAGPANIRLKKKLLIIFIPFSYFRIRYTFSAECYSHVESGSLNSDYFHFSWKSRNVDNVEQDAIALPKKKGKRGDLQHG